MKKFLYLLIGTLLILGLGKLIINKSQITNNKEQINNKIQVPNSIAKPTANQNSLTTSFSRSIFVPYWAGQVSGEDIQYTNYYYFGVQPTKEGDLENEVGLQNISLVEIIPEKQKKLVLRMLNTSVNEVLLQDELTQKTLTTQIKKLMDKNTFSGIVIDLEVPFSLQSGKQKQISNFVQQMCTEIHKDYKSCSVLVYGDMVYRKRPYDLKKLGEVADTILIMAYDFHKAGGEPGPNFPLSRRSIKSEGGSETTDYGYDFKQMVMDFSKVVPREKLEVVFGMYGYDWTLNAQGTPLKTAQAMSLKEIQAQISNHKFQITNQSQISNSKEKNIKYTDKEGREHVVWYEDEESSAIKIKYLEEQGIGKVSFWAYSYF